MAFEIHEGFKRTVTVAFTKADGTPGVVEGVPVWSMLPFETSTMLVSEDGMSADITWAGVGEAMLSVVADGDIGVGVFPVTLTETFNFVAPLGATTGSLGVGDEIAI